MAEFVKTMFFRELNVKFVIDESCACPFVAFFLFYGERTTWQFALHIKSQPGHAAMQNYLSCLMKKPNSDAKITRTFISGGANS